MQLFGWIKISIWHKLTKLFEVLDDRHIDEWSQRRWWTRDWIHCQYEPLMITKNNTWYRQTDKYFLILKKRYDSLPYRNDDSQAYNFRNNLEMLQFVFFQFRPIALQILTYAVANRCLSAIPICPETCRCVLNRAISVLNRARRNSYHSCLWTTLVLGYSW